MKTAKCETDISDAQWAFLEQMIPKPNNRGRPRGDRGAFINAILYLVSVAFPGDSCL